MINSLRNFESPFAIRAKEYKYRFQGGKLDDITVIVAYIKEIKSHIDKSITRENSSTDLAESAFSDKSQLSPNNNLKERLSKIKLNGML